jgi:hypothetical protein
MFSAKENTPLRVGAGHVQNEIKLGSLYLFFCCGLLISELASRTLDAYTFLRLWALDARPFHGVCYSPLLKDRGHQRGVIGK